MNVGKGGWRGRFAKKRAPSSRSRRGTKGTSKGTLKTTVLPGRMSNNDREDADFFFGEVGFSAIFSPSKCLLHGEEQSLFRLSINRFASSEFNRLLLHRSFVSSAERE